MSNADKKLVFVIDGNVKSATDAMRGLDDAIKKVGTGADVAGTALADLQKAAKDAADVAEDAAKRQVSAQGLATAAVEEHAAAEQKVADATEAAARQRIESEKRVAKFREAQAIRRQEDLDDLNDVRANKEDVRLSTKGDRSKEAVKARMAAVEEVRIAKQAFDAKEKAAAKALKAVKAEEKARRAAAEESIKLARSEASAKLDASKEAGRAARAVAREALVATAEVERRIATAQKLVDKLERQASPDGQRDAAFQAFRIKNDEEINKRIADIQRMRDVALTSEKNSPNERAQIEAAAGAAIARERAKLNSAEIAAMNRLGLRRKQQIQEEIAAVRKAGQDAASVYAKGSGDRLRIERATAAQIKTLNKELANASASAFTQRMESAAKGMQGLGEGLTNAGQALAPAGIAAGAALGFSIRDAANFEQQIQNIKALYRSASDEQLEQLEALTRDRGANNKSFDAQEVGKAAEILASQDVSVEDVMDGALDAVISAAAGTGSDIESAAKLVTQAGNIFGIAAKDLQGVSDTAAGLLDISKFGVQDLALAMSQGGSVAKAVGLDFKEFSAIIGVMSKSFESGSDAGTSLKTFIQSLTNDGKAQVAARKLLGFDPFDEKGELRDPRELIAALEKAKGKLTTEEFIGALTDQFGSDAARAAAALADGGVETYDKAVAGVEKGDAEAARAIREQGLNAELNALGNAVKELNIALGETGFLGMVTSAVQKLTEFVRWFAELDPMIQSIAIGFAAVLAVGVPTIIVLGKLAWGISQIIALWPRIMLGVTAVRTFIAAWTGAGTVIGVVMTALRAVAALFLGWPGLLVAGFALAIWYFKDEIISVFTWVFDWVTDKWTKFWGWLWGDANSQSNSGPVPGEPTPPRPGSKVGDAPAYADGGRVRGPGTSRSDSIWARLSDDEHVINARATRFFGHGLMESLNALDPTAVLRPVPVPVRVNAGQGAGLHPVTLDLRDGPVSGLYGTPDAIRQVERHIERRRNTQYASQSRSS